MRGTRRRACSRRHASGSPLRGRGELLRRRRWFGNPGLELGFIAARRSSIWVRGRGRRMPRARHGWRGRRVSGARGQVPARVGHGASVGYGRGCTLVVDRGRRSCLARRRFGGWRSPCVRRDLRRFSWLGFGAGGACRRDRLDRRRGRSGRWHAFLFDRAGRRARTRARLLGLGGAGCGWDALLLGLGRCRGSDAKNRFFALARGGRAGRGSLLDLVTSDRGGRGRWRHRLTRSGYGGWDSIRPSRSGLGKAALFVGRLHRDD